MDHENSDDKNGSIIQETEGQRTEMSASSDVVVESEPSMAPHDNFNTVTRIPENSEVHFVKPERASSAPSCLSVRSDTSMGRPINFRESIMMKQDRGVSPAVSDRSMDHPFNFKRELTTPDSGVGASPAPSCLSVRSDTSMGRPINFRESIMMKQDRGVSPAVSDRSMDHPFNFKRELTTPDSGVGASPAPSCLSMRSDKSMGRPINFRRELTTPDSGVGASPAPSCLSMRSDKSMGQPFNFRECPNEFGSSLLTSDYVRCSLCSSILTNPVSIPCGHSYCEHCINIHWSQPGPTGDYVCLLCNQSYPTRPVLSVNVALNWMLQALQETSFSPACPTLPQAGPGDVACDICSSLKLRAVKTCVTCSASYCENHVRQHYTAPALQKHTLVQVNEDTRLSQWERNSVKMEDIKEESFVDGESEEHQEVACKRRKMDVINEDEMFQHGSLEHSDLKNVSTHLQPEQEKDLKYVIASEMEGVTSAILRQSPIDKAIRIQCQLFRDLKDVSESDIERATSAILRLHSLISDRKYANASEMEGVKSAILRLRSKFIRDLKCVSESEMELATSAMLRLQSLTRDRKYDSESEMEGVTSAILRQSLIDIVKQLHRQLLHNLKYVSDSEMEGATSAILQLQSLTCDHKYVSVSEMELATSAILRLQSLTREYNEIIKPQLGQEHSLAKQPLGAK